MSRRISATTLQASTIDILNTIRQNASAAYQANVPSVTQAKDIPKVGDVLFGYPALANEFLNELVNRIAFVAIRSANFNDPYTDLYKGYLETGETIEEVYVNLTKAREFSQEKAESRELKRYIPDVKTSLHCINWKVVYPISISQEELARAFISEAGVQDLITRIIESVYTSAKYDAYLLVKYMLIKAITSGIMYPVAVDTSNNKNSAIAFRGYSNDLGFIHTEYNGAGVHTNTPRSDQAIFMDSFYNATFDVDVLAAAFNMEKADFMGRLYLIDNWTKFDNERFDYIRAESTGLEAVTSTELALMANVKGVLVDKEFFQIYTNLETMRDTQISSGLYWNYFYHVWKTISYSPFANAIVFVDNSASLSLESTYTATVTGKTVSAEGTVITLELADSDTLANMQIKHIQTSDAVSTGVGVQPYGAYMFPAPVSPATYVTTQIQVMIGGISYDLGDTGGTPNELSSALDVGDTVTLYKTT